MKSGEINLSLEGVEVEVGGKSLHPWLFGCSISDLWEAFVSERCI